MTILKTPTSPYNDVHCPFCSRGYDIDSIGLLEGIYKEKCPTCENRFTMAVEVFPNEFRCITVLTKATPLQIEEANKIAMENVMKSVENYGKKTTTE